MKITRDVGLSFGDAIASLLEGEGEGDFVVRFDGGNAKIFGPVTIGTDYFKFFVTVGPTAIQMVLPFHSIIEISDNPDKYSN